MLHRRTYGCGPAELAKIMAQTARCLDLMPDPLSGDTRYNYSQIPEKDMTAEQQKAGTGTIVAFQPRAFE